MNIEKITKLFCISSVLLPFCTVFIIDNSLAKGVISGKYFWFYGSMVLVSMATLISLFVCRQKFRFVLQDLFVIAFCLLAIFLSYIKVGAVTTKPTLLLILLLLYFSLRVLFIQYKNTELWLSFFILIGGLIEVVWGLGQLYGFADSQHRIFITTGSFFNPAPFAGYLAIVLPLSIYFIINKETEYKLLSAIIKYSSATVCLTIILILPATISRASWLAAIAGCITVFVGHYSIWLKSFYKKHNKWICPVVIVYLLVFYLALTNIYHLKKDSADGRLLMWKIAYKTAIRHPWGVGLGGFPVATGETQIAYFEGEEATANEKLLVGSPEYAFNEYLQIAIESGVAGLSLFFIIMGFAVRNLLLNKKYGLLGALVALLVFAFFSYPFNVLPFMIILVFLLVASRREETGLPKISIKNHLLIINLSGISTFVCLFVAFRQWPVYKAYQHWEQVQNLYLLGFYKDASEKYENLYPYLNDRADFLFEYAQCLSKQVVDSESHSNMTMIEMNSMLSRSNVVLHRAMQTGCDPMFYAVMGKNFQVMKKNKQAELCYLKATYLVPNRLYPWYLLTKLYSEMGLTSHAKKTAEIVLKKEPKVQSSAIKEMRKEVEKILNELPRSRAVEVSR